MKRVSRKLSKKGSLELSINAIVILVIAITMLGLGLGFTRGMFDKFSSQLVVPEPDIPATAQNPIVIGIGDSLNLQRNKEAVFSVNVYNSDWGSDESVSGKLYCIGDLKALTAISGSQTILPGEDKNFPMIISQESTSTPGTGICTLEFQGDATGSLVVTKQITVKVQ